MTAPSVVAVVTCKHCPRMYRGNEEGARFLGWRIFKGASVTGKPLDDTACPVCAGTATDPEPLFSWRVRCNTCHWESEEDEDVDMAEPLDGKAARYLASNHECEPWIEVQPPGSETWYPRNYLNRDGSLREDKS